MRLRGTHTLVVVDIILLSRIANEGQAASPPSAVECTYCRVEGVTHEGGSNSSSRAAYHHGTCSFPYDPFLCSPLVVAVWTIELTSSFSSWSRVVSQSCSRCFVTEIIKRGDKISLSLHSSLLSTDGRADGRTDGRTEGE